MTALQTALAWAIVHFLWQGAAVAAALGATLFFCRSPRIRYIGASVALAAMLASFAVTLAISWPADPHFHASSAPLPPLHLAPAPPFPDRGGGFQSTLGGWGQMGSGVEVEGGQGVEGQR